MQIVYGSTVANGCSYYEKLNGDIYSNFQLTVSTSFNDKTVSWYNLYTSFSNAKTAINQMNNSGTTYYWIAIG